ncbi:rab-GTPase-TBC domain-containing protein [Lyophyllum atratum]|nr:rab-GTPase-TBC domain-containing protein [Lyophyllum atratum]
MATMAPSEPTQAPESFTSSFDEKISQIDWEGLRRRSLQPGGFGTNRIQIWPQLLHVSKLAERTEERGELVEEHRDERQIRLDTDRSFVLYPVDTPLEAREAMQMKLNRLLVSVFRRRPKLNYFQGYHDIVSVLFLTLPEEIQLACVEKISLHRVRDSMGATLEPVLGLLRLTKNLLRQADPQYAEVIERTSPLPFFALSNLLTLFSHDMPTLPLIQHVFDYILCRPPIIIVYLATAIILSRKEEIQKLEEDEDEDIGMAHSVLSSLPDISDADETKVGGAEVQELVNGSLEDSLDATKEEVAPSLKLEEDTEPDDQLLDQVIAVKTKDLEEELVTATVAEEAPLSDVMNEESSSISLPPACSSQPTPSSSHPASSRTASPTPPFSSRPSASQIPLTSLLTHAEALYALYPPTQPALGLASIMGPQSVVYTWSESPDLLPKDDEAETMVVAPGLVVYPYIEDDEDEVAEDGENGAEGEWEEKSPPQNKRRREKVKKLRGKVRGRFRKLRRLGVERRTGTMVAGAVLVLGVAMAVYGVRMRGNHAGAGMYGFADGHGHGHGRDWKKVVGWVGGAVVGVTERVLSGLGPS